MKRSCCAEPSVKMGCFFLALQLVIKSLKILVHVPTNTYLNKVYTVVCIYNFGTMLCRKDRVRYGISGYGFSRPGIQN